MLGSPLSEYFSHPAFFPTIRLLIVKDVVFGFSSGSPIFTFQNPCLSCLHEQQTADLNVDIEDEM